MIQKILFLIIFFPLIIVSQQAKNDSSINIYKLYNENTVYLKSNFWTGTKLIKNEKSYSFSDFEKNFLPECSEALSEYKLYKKNEKYSLISFILSGTALVLTVSAGKKDNKDMVPVYGISSLGLMFIGGFFQNKAFDHFQLCIWKYNRYVINK